MHKLRQHPHPIEADWLGEALLLVGSCAAMHITLFPLFLGLDIEVRARQRETHLNPDNPLKPTPSVYAYMYVV